MAMINFNQVAPIDQADNNSVQSPKSSQGSEPRRLSLQKVEVEGKKAVQLQSRACGWNVVLFLGIRRNRHFNRFAACVLVGGCAWLGVRCWMAVDGENSVARDAWNNVAVSIRNSIQVRLVQDLIYQDSIANIWTTDPNITRDRFQKLVLSEVYAPALVAMSGMSLINRVIGQDQRAMLERDVETEQLRQKCCDGLLPGGSNCGNIAATGLFCSGANPHYQITQFGAGGKLVPANGTDATYLNKVGQEEYMVVDMIEPFMSNAKVWGFNLLSSDARLAAWRSAMITGKKTFTRRLNLVQSTSKEFGFLVWLPIFERTVGGSWTTAMSGAGGLIAVGSVNGVYKAQVLVNQALKGTFAKEQLEDTSVFLFDNAAELNGTAQFLAAYNSPENDPYEAYKDSTPQSVTSECGLHRTLDLEIENADARWIVVTCGSDKYLSRKRTLYPELTTAIGLCMLFMSTIDRLLGHPAVMKGTLYKSEDSVDPENPMPCSN